MIIYLLFEVIILFVLFRFSGKRITEKIRLIAFGYAVLAFFQIASEASDLQVAFEHLNNIKTYGITYFGTTSAAMSDYFTGKIGLQMYFYFLSLLPVNNFYSAISIFIIYYCVLYSIHNVSAYYEVDYQTESKLLALFILMFDFYDASNGVRNILAFALFIYFLVRELYTDKRSVISWIMYAVSFSIHPAVGVLLLVRLFLFVKRKSLKCIIGIGMVLWSLGLTGIAEALSSFTNIPLISSLHSKIISYSLVQGTNSNFNSFNTSKSYLMMRDFRILFLICLMIILYMLWRRGKTSTMISSFCLYLTAFSMGASAANIATNVLTRYSYCLIMICPILYIEYMELVERKVTVLFGNFKCDLPFLSLLVCTALFNVYMYIYHYIVMEFGFVFYI